MRKIGLALIVSLLVSASAFAQNSYRGSVKFVCGRADSKSIESFAFSPGLYYTTINVTNPNRIEVAGTKRFSIGLLQQTPGKFSERFNWKLKSSETMQIDCGDIYKRLGLQPGPFIDGFVHIVGSPLRFDVTAVYTLSDGDRPVSVDVEAITLR